MWELLKEFTPVMAVIVPLVGAIIVWYLNERAKRHWEMYKRKEERYLTLLGSICGFYVGSKDAEQKADFIAELRFAWLYCPDEVIRKGNEFLATVSSGAKCSDQEKEGALAEFVIALRHDLHPGTELTVDDYRNWRST